MGGDLLLHKAHDSKVLERDANDRERRGSFWNRFSLSRASKGTATHKSKDTSQPPMVKVSPATPTKTLPARHGSRHSTASSVSQASSQDVLSGSVFTFKSNSLSLSMPPSMGMAFTRSTSSRESTYPSYDPPGRTCGSMNSASLLQIQEFSQRLDQLGGGDKDKPGTSHWAEFARATALRKGPAVFKSARPAITPLFRASDQYRERQDSTVSSGNVPALSYGQSTASTTSVQSAISPVSARTASSGSSSSYGGNDTHIVSTAQMRGPLQEAKSPMMMAVPSSSGKSVTAEYGVSLGVGAYGSMVLMDAHDAGYLGSLSPRSDEGDEFARSVEARLKEIMGISD